MFWTHSHSLRNFWKFVSVPICWSDLLWKFWTSNFALIWWNDLLWNPWISILDIFSRSLLAQMTPTSFQWTKILSNPWKTPKIYQNFQTFAKIELAKDSLVPVEPPKEPPGLIALFISQITLLPSPQGAIEVEIKLNKLNLLELNHQRSQVFPKCQDLTSCHPLKLPLSPLLKGLKLFRKVYQPNQNWRLYF